MAVTTQKLDSLKIGDTPTIYVTLSPIGNTSWSGVTYDIAMTAVDAPTDNTGAVAVLTSQALIVNADGTATATMTLTTAQANALVVNTLYHVELQLKQSGLVSTVFTGTIQTVQDYVK